MSTWQSVAGYKGYYESPALRVDFDGDALLSKITWSGSVPEGSRIRVFILLSFDNMNWNEWQEAFLDGSIPSVFDYSTQGNFYMKYRIFLDSSDKENGPVFDSIEFEFEPVLVFNNLGDAPCKPEMWITKSGNGDFKLINTSLGNEEFVFTSLLDEETVYVNNDNEDIETSLAATYRYSNFNDNYLSIPPGINIYRVSGNATFRFRYQFKLL